MLDGADLKRTSMFNIIDKPLGGRYEPDSYYKTVKEEDKTDAMLALKDSASPLTNPRSLSRASHILF